MNRNLDEKPFLIELCEHLNVIWLIILNHFRKKETLKKIKKLKKTVKKIKRPSSTRSLSKILKPQKKVQETTDGGDASSGSVGWIGEFTSDMLDDVYHKNLQRILKIARDKPEQLKKYKKLFKSDRKFLERLELELEKTPSKKQKFSEKRKEKKVQKIIKSAIKRSDINLTKAQRQEAADFYKKNAHRAKNKVELAQIALLGVLNVYLTGTHRPVIQINWGNLFAAPDYNIYHGFDGGSAIDQADRIAFTYGDPLGLEAEAIISAMEKGGYYPEFIHLIEEQGFEFDPQTNKVGIKKVKKSAKRQRLTM